MKIVEEIYAVENITTGNLVLNSSGGFYRNRDATFKKAKRL